MITNHKKHNFLNYCQRCDKIIHFYETFPDKKDKIITEDGFMQWLFTQPAAQKRLPWWCRW